MGMKYFKMLAKCIYLFYKTFRKKSMEMKIDNECSIVFMSNFSDRDKYCREFICTERWSHRQILNDGIAEHALMMFSLNMTSTCQNSSQVPHGPFVWLDEAIPVEKPIKNQKRDLSLWWDFLAGLSDSCPINLTLCFLMWSWCGAQRQMCREIVTGNTFPAQPRKVFCTTIQHGCLLNMYDNVCISY